MTIWLENQIMTDADANTWAQEVDSKCTPRFDFPVRILHQPNYGRMYGCAIDPTDEVYGPSTDRGVYALIGVRGTSEFSRNWSVMLFDFTVGPARVGDVLDWKFAGRETGTGLSTRILDSLGHSVAITDNSLMVVPEPPSYAQMAVLPALSALWWRRARCVRGRVRRLGPGLPRRSAAGVVRARGLCSNQQPQRLGIIRGARSSC